MSEQSPKLPAPDSLGLGKKLLYHRQILDLGYTPEQANARLIWQYNLLKQMSDDIAGATS